MPNSEVGLKLSQVTLERARSRILQWRLGAKLWKRIFWVVGWVTFAPKPGLRAYPLPHSPYRGRPAASRRLIKRKHWLSGHPGRELILIRARQSLTSLSRFADSHAVISRLHFRATRLIVADFERNHRAISCV
jgi:hypothetical protein